MHLDIFHKSTACLPGELWVTTSCPLSKQGVQEACMAWYVVCCQQTQHALIWAAFSLHMAGQPGIYSCRGQWCQWATKHGQTQMCPCWQSILLASLRALHSQVIITWHVTAAFPLLLHPVMQTKVGLWKVAVFSPGSSQLLPPPHCLLPMLPLLPVLMLLGHWDKGLRHWVFCFWWELLVSGKHIECTSWSEADIVVWVRVYCFSPRHFIN